MESNIKGFVFQPSYFEAINDLATNEDKLEMFEGITKYGIYGEEPQFSNPYLKAIFRLVIPTLDASKTRYTNSVENGKKGGRPKSTTKSNNQTIQQVLEPSKIKNIIAETNAGQVKETKPTTNTQSKIKVTEASLINKKSLTISNLNKLIRDVNLDPTNFILDEVLLNVMKENININKGYIDILKDEVGLRFDSEELKNIINEMINA